MDETIRIGVTAASVDFVKKIIYDKGIGLIDKVIKIDRFFQGEAWDPKKLSEVLDIPVALILQEPEPTLIPLPKGKDKPNPKPYIDYFFQIYLKIKKKEFSFTPGDIGIMLNMAKFFSFEKFKAAMNYLLLIHNNQKMVKIEFEQRNILTNLNPGRVYKNMNFLVCEADKTKAGGWGYGMDQKK